MTGSGVVVLGMHRGGTSAITRTVNLLGVPTCVPDDLYRDRTANLRGHWESGTAVRHNEELLRAAGAAWWCPPPLETDWVARASERLQPAAEAFARVHPTPSWVWKDPRTCITAPFWQAALPHRVIFVLAVRHPAAVAASLASRNGFTTEASVAVWEGYMARAARAATGTPTIVCCYEAMVRDPLGWAEAARDFLLAQGVELDSKGSPALAARSVEETLVHHRGGTGAGQLTGEQGALFATLMALVGPHEQLAPDLPPVTAATERLFAEGRRMLLPPEQRNGAVGGPSSEIQLLVPRRRRSAGLPPISVVIAPRRPGPGVESTLDAVLATAPPSSEVIVVGEVRARADPRVTVVARPAAGGRVGAIAAGVAQAGGEVVVLCDSGVRPGPGWPEVFAAVLKRSDVGVVGPALLPGDGEAVYALRLCGASLNVAWATMARVPAVAGGEPFAVVAVSGAMMAFRRDAIEAVGGFDPGMTGSGGEDVELCIRLWRAGCLCVVAPQASAVVCLDEEPPDPMGWLHNRLRLGVVHLSPPRLRRFLEPLRRRPGFAEAFARVLSSDVGDRRLLVDAISCFDDAWWLRRFAITALEEPAGQPRIDGIRPPWPVPPRRVAAAAGSDAEPTPAAEPHPGAIRYSITVDGPPRFRRQALGWLATGAALGGVTQDQVLVQCTDAVPDAFRRAVSRTFGVEVTALPRGDGRRGTLNKLSQLANRALDGDWVVLCDCDTAFAEPLPAAAFGPGIAAKLVDVGLPDLEFWSDLLGRLGVPIGPREARRAAKGGGVTYRNNCNGGLYIGDRAHWARIGPEWQRVAEALPGWIAAPAYWSAKYDQIAFGVACARLGIDVELLPARLNFPFHEDPPAPMEVRPVILHHHQGLEKGRLSWKPGHAACPGVMAAVERVNRILDRLDWKAFGL